METSVLHGPHVVMCFTTRALMPVLDPGLTFLMKERAWLSLPQRRNERFTAEVVAQTKAEAEDAAKAVTAQVAAQTPPGTAIFRR